MKPAPVRSKDGQERDAWMWREILKGGPTALLRERWTEVTMLVKDEKAREALRVFLEDVVEQTAWIVQARAELVSETARVAELGIVMRKAGLRSYTDREGRIYVAEGT